MNHLSIVQNICRAIFILSYMAAIVQYYYDTLPEMHIVLIIYESMMMFLLLVQYFLTYRFIVHNLIIFASLMMTMICLMTILLDRKVGVTIAYTYTMVLSTFMFITNELITAQLHSLKPQHRSQSQPQPRPPVEDDDSLVDFTDSAPLIDLLE